MCETFFCTLSKASNYYKFNQKQYMMVNKNYLLSMLGGYNYFKVALLIKFFYNYLRGTLLLTLVFSLVTVTRLIRLMV